MGVGVGGSSARTTVIVGEGVGDGSSVAVAGGVGDDVGVGVEVAASVAVAGAVGDAGGSVGVAVADAVGDGTASGVSVTCAVAVGVSFPWAASPAGASACQPSTRARNRASRIGLKVVSRWFTLIVPCSAKSGDIIPELGLRVNVAICHLPHRSSPL